MNQGVRLGDSWTATLVCSESVSLRFLEGWHRFSRKGRRVFRYLLRIESRGTVIAVSLAAGSQEPAENGGNDEHSMENSGITAGARRNCRVLCGISGAAGPQRTRT